MVGRPKGRKMHQDNDNQNKNSPKIILPHGGYRDLQSYQMSEIVYDGTVAFCDRFISKRSRTQMRAQRRRS
jgi:hypothetical protein